MTEIEQLHEWRVWALVMHGGEFSGTDVELRNAISLRIADFIVMDRVRRSEVEGLRAQHRTAMETLERIKG